MIKKCIFNRHEFITNQSPLNLVLFIISLILDLVLIWKLTYGLPINVGVSTENLKYWRIGLGFLIIINALTLKIWNIYSFTKKLARYQSGFVEISENGILHCIEKREIHANRVKFEQGYVMDESKKMYEYVLVYKICEVKKYEKSKSGNFTIYGKIELDCLDETLGLEMGIDDHTVTQLNRHRIPAYYDGMDIIQLKLDEMLSKNNFGFN